MALGAVIASGATLTADPDLGAASVVEVYERLGEVTTYALRFAVAPKDGDLSWLAEAKVSPGAEIAVLVPTSEGNVCLVKGPVTGQHVRLVNGAAGSWVEVYGADSSSKLDREAKATVWAEVADSDAVSSIVAGYGLVSDAQATDGRSTENKHVLVQRETDLRFVRRLARRNGHLFWITCDATTGIETAHFKRPPLDGEPTATLVVNQDGANVQTLDLKWDVERPTTVTALQLDLGSKQDLDGTVQTSPQTLLGATGLAAAAGAVRSVFVSGPADDLGALKARAEGAALEAEWFVTATGETTLAALGKALRAHTVVELAGAGSRHSGKYLVAGVRHVIDPAGHRMVFELVRNAWGAA